MKKAKGVVPKTKKGKAQVKKLGRTKKTGGFKKIVKGATKKYGKTAAKKIAGKVFQKMVAKKK